MGIFVLLNPEPFTEGWAEHVSRQLVRMGSWSGGVSFLIWQPQHVWFAKLGHQWAAAYADDAVLYDQLMDHVSQGAS